MWDVRHCWHNYPFQVNMFLLTALYLDAYIMTNLFSTIMLVGRSGYTVFVKGVFASLPPKAYKQ